MNIHRKADLQTQSVNLRQSQTALTCSAINPALPRIFLKPNKVRSPDAQCLYLGGIRKTSAFESGRSSHDGRISIHQLPFELQDRGLMLNSYIPTMRSSFYFPSKWDHFSLNRGKRNHLKKVKNKKNKSRKS